MSISKETSYAYIGVDGLEIIIEKGLYPEEKILANRFLVSSKVKYNPAIIKSGTYINYENLCRIMKDSMDMNIHLLEEIALSMARSVFSEWTEAQFFQVRIEKTNPPFSGLKPDSVFVELGISREELKSL